MPRVTFQPADVSISQPTGATLRDAAIAAGVPLHAGLRRLLNCRGHGLCGACRVKVHSGADGLGRVGFREKLARLRGLKLDDAERLACRTELTGADVVVETTPA